MNWLPIETAPRDGTRMLLLTSDFGVIEGWWDERRINFYASQKGWASYDKTQLSGDWVTDFPTPDNDPRLFCGSTPHYWMPLPAPPN